MLNASTTIRSRRAVRRSKRPHGARVRERAFADAAEHEFVDNAIGILAGRAQLPEPRPLEKTTGSGVVCSGDSEEPVERSLLLRPGDEEARRTCARSNAAIPGVEDAVLARAIARCSER